MTSTKGTCGEFLRSPKMKASIDAIILMMNRPLPSRKGCKGCPYFGDEVISNYLWWGSGWVESETTARRHMCEKHGRLVEKDDPICHYRAAELAREAAEGEGGECEPKEDPYL